MGEMAEKSDKKVKGFRISPEIAEKLSEIIKESGKEDGEWFEDLVLQISSNELVLEKSGVPADLRKHFSSDLSAIKDATNSILTLFVNQMNRIAVEKNNWNQYLQTQIQDYENKLSKLKNNITQLEQTIQEKDAELSGTHNTILQLQNKIEGFDKLETQLRKDIERLEEEVNKYTKEIQRLRDESLFEKEKLYNDINELKNTHKEEKDRLNQQIVDMVKQLNEMKPLSEENKELQKNVDELRSSIEQLNEEHKIKINQLVEQAAVDKEKALLKRERELRELFYKQSREDMKELYSKIDKLQSENNELRLENASLLQRFNGRK
jgi:chromosome segregation ATPase